MYNRGTVHRENFPEKANLNKKMEKGRGGLVRIHATRIT